MKIIAFNGSPRTWQPRMSAADRQKGIEGWLKAIERTFHWVDA